MKYDIFISYRRDGGDTLAQLIYDRLVHRGYKVFLDIESLRSGKFNEKLLEVIEECKDVVLILPSNALERCNNPEDWVLREITHSINCQKNIVPVMMKGFVWPETLPHGLEELPNYNGIQDSKDYFDAAIDKMTSLLVSKPSVIRWGGLGNAKAKEAKKYNFKEKLARRKKMIIATVVTVVLATGIGAVCYHQYLKKQEELATMVSIVLYAPEEMSATEYYDAIEILEKRFEILAGDSKYYFEVENDKIHVNIPLDVFGEVDVETILKCYVTRPAELYLCFPGEGDIISYEDYVSLERTEIEDISIEKGTVPYIDAQKYGFEENEEYYYSKITFTDKAQEEIENIWGQNVKVFRLLQDREQYPTNFYWYDLVVSDEENVYYLVDVYQQENINELVKYNYLNDTFSEGFTFNVIYPVEWEKVDDATIKGEYQCDFKELLGDQVIVQYAASQYSEVTDGEFQDTIRGFKKRLDALETPYAFGYTQGGEKQISIKLDLEHMGLDLIYMLGGPSVNLNITNPFVSLSIYSAEAECVLGENDTYALEFSVSESKASEIKEKIAEIECSNNQEIYFSFENSYRRSTLTKGDVNDVFRKIDEGKIIFDNLIGWGLESIDTENKYWAEFVTTCYAGADLPLTYYVEHYRAEGAEESQFGVQSEYMEQSLEVIEENVVNICPTATCNWSGTALNIYLNLELNDELPQKAIDTIKKIYEQCELNKGEYRVKIECASGDKESLAFIFYVSFINDGLEYYGSYYGVQMEKYREEFKRLVNEDAFLKQEMVPAYENWLEDWNFLIGL